MPSHLKISGGPRMARAALSRRAIDGPSVGKLTSYTGRAGRPVFAVLAARRATYGPYRPQLDGPFRRAKEGPSQMRRPVWSVTGRPISPSFSSLPYLSWHYNDVCCVGNEDHR